MKKMRLFSAVMAIVMICSTFCTGISADEAPVASKDAEIKTTSIFNSNSYKDYMKKYEKENRNVEEIVIKGGEYSSAEGVEEQMPEIEGVKGPFAKQSNEGYVEYVFKAAKTGLYNMSIQYYTVDGNGTDMERSLMIDGEYPFTEAGSISLYRLWKNETDIKTSPSGDDETPKQVETHRLETVYVKDSADFYGNFAFYLTEGTHTLRINTIKEPMIIGEIKFVPIVELPTYSEYYAKKTAEGAKVITGMEEPITLQAELPEIKNTAVLAPKYDRSTPNVYPYDGAKLRLNVIGEDSFSSVGLWTEYVIRDVPENGLYVLTFKSKQSIARGLNIGRRIYVNGEVPFVEADAFEFEYSSTYYNKVLGDGENPYYIYLKKGDNTLRVESCLGRIADVVSEGDRILSELNDAYRKIIVITGTSPDNYRDYELKDKIPEVVALFDEMVVRLTNLYDNLVGIAGEKSSYTSTLELLLRQMTRMSEDPDQIQEEVTALYNNLASLGTWVSDLQEMDISTDCIYIGTDDTVLPKPKASVWQRIKHEVVCFFATFYNDYTSIGGVQNSGEAITLWTSGGRDQAEIVRRMINSEFTPKTGINVNLRLTGVGLINATVAGIAPDVFFGAADTINMALRGAVYDVSKFEDFPEVKSWFPSHALIPLTFEGATYGIPTTGTFNVLYYRADILESLNLKVPETWEDLYAMLPILQRNNMEFGLAAATGESYAMMLYQNGGSWYNEENTRAMFDSELSIRTMEKWSELYTNYGLPLAYDPLNRFRSGEMPMYVGSYISYNTLAVFAPQIKSLWSWGLVPGTRRADGTVDHSVLLYVNSNIIPAAAEDKGTLDNAWTFLKWFSDAPAQVEYAQEVENLLGPSGRYCPINLEALKKMPWSTSEYKLLKEQLDYSFTIPEVPGAYYVSRYLENSFRTSMNTSKEIRELLVDNTKEINKEITRKRAEFKLSVYEEEAK